MVLLDKLMTIKELRLPAWAMHGAMGILTLGLGYTIAEVKNSRNAREVLVDRVVQEIVPNIMGRLLAHDIQIAALSGSQERIEKKVDLSLEKQDMTNRAVARLEAKIDRLR